MIEHLLKLEFSPSEQPRARLADSIAQARIELIDLLTASIRPDVESDLASLFDRGRQSAAKALRRHGEREAANALPAACPYSFEQIVGQDWYPQNRHGVGRRRLTSARPRYWLSASWSLSAAAFSLATSSGTWAGGISPR